jgi:hypothetical protein
VIRPIDSASVWFALTTGGALGALILWAALNDPWWLAIAVVLLVIPGPGHDGEAS